MMAELLYVGQAVSIGWRVRTHFMNRVDRKTRVIWFDHFSSIEVPRYWLNEVESHYILTLQPPFNVRGLGAGPCKP